MRFFCGKKNRLIPAPRASLNSPAKIVFLKRRPVRPEQDSHKIKKRQQEKSKSKSKVPRSGFVRRVSGSGVRPGAVVRTPSRFGFSDLENPSSGSRRICL